MHLTAVFRAAFCVAVCVTTYLALTSEALPEVFSIWDKGNHAFAFLVLSFLLDFSFPANASPIHTSNLMKAGILLVYALLIELAQWYVGYRDAEVTDVIAGGIGILIYASLMPVTNKLRILRELRCPTPQAPN